VKGSTFNGLEPFTETTVVCESLKSMPPRFSSHQRDILTTGFEIPSELLYIRGMDSSPHILVVDDHQEIRDLLAKFLDKHGLRVTTAADGNAMRKVLEVSRIDLIVLDLMLPGEDGLTLCRQLRSRSSIPVVMLTAIGEETDRIIGLEIGADDYVSKPFNPRELLARIKAVLRRANSLPDQSHPPGHEKIEFGDWTLWTAKRELESSDGVIVPLSTGEFNLLYTFIQHPQRVLNRDQLLDLTQGREAIPFDRSIDTQVSRLRRKIEDDPKDPKILKTVWGGGYIFTPMVPGE
jgi:two-component system, OmpR family, response regulator